MMSFSPEEALKRYRRLVEGASMPKATRGLHPITQKLVTGDERLAKLANHYSLGEAEVSPAWAFKLVH